MSGYVGVLTRNLFLSVSAGFISNRIEFSEVAQSNVYHIVCWSCTYSWACWVRSASAVLSFFIAGWLGARH